MRTTEAVGMKQVLSNNDKLDRATMAFPNALARQGSRTEINVGIPLGKEEKIPQEVLKGVG